LIGVVINHANRSSLKPYYYHYRNYGNAKETKQNQNGYKPLGWLKRDRSKKSGVTK
jgi:hypothetical protein